MSGVVGVVVVRVVAVDVEFEGGEGGFEAGGFLGGAVVGEGGVEVVVPGGEDVVQEREGVAVHGFLLSLAAFVEDGELGGMFVVADGGVDGALVHAGELGDELDVGRPLGDERVHLQYEKVLAGNEPLPGVDLARVDGWPQAVVGMERIVQLGDPASGVGVVRLVDAGSARPKTSNLSLEVLRMNEPGHVPRDGFAEDGDEARIGPDPVRHRSLEREGRHEIVKLRRRLHEAPRTSLQFLLREELREAAHELCARRGTLRDVDAVRYQVLEEEVRLLPHEVRFPRVHSHELGGAITQVLRQHAVDRRRRRLLRSEKPQLRPAVRAVAQALLPQRRVIVRRRVPRRP
eukprot:CAMPEP_0198657500 /NCGR_PEP_ID=MMETSP1467-20131203/16762_1 /TAXON_ID=1462469 /ORGANISM="unid. sp., Strain CCMP2135" /LENGTH=345 /DNA_ID=CAMNT_0044393685 /DNA_START=174 /DNA_END=1211 /DNA_ORIENTATION=-